MSPPLLSETIVLTVLFCFWCDISGNKILYNISLKITCDPCNVINFPWPVWYMHKSHLYPRQWDRFTKTQQPIGFQDLFEEIKQIAGKWETFCNKRMNRGICDDRFSRNKLDFAENVRNGGNNSVEITRLARAETPHDFLVHWDLLRASFYGRQGWDSVLVPQQTLFEEHSNINHATVKAKLIVAKAVQGTCLKTNWCEVLL